VTRTRIVFFLALAAVGAAVALFGGVLSGSGSKAAVAATRITADRLSVDFATSNTATYVLQLQDALRSQPSNVQGLGLLGLAYQQRARETGDPAYYTKSAGVLGRALRLSPHDLVATGALGSLALSRHRFRDALALGRRARNLSPTTARTYGVIGDALVELGRYRRAFAAFDRLARLKPGLNAYARVSYARELRGDFAGAVQAMKLALESAVGEREALAWTHVQLGKLYWSHGHVAQAAHEDRAALAVFPGYPSGLDALALAEAAGGQTRSAVTLEQRAVAAIPLPQYVSNLGDLLRSEGRMREARRQYALIRVIQRLLVANGVKTDLETALFDVDHGIGVPNALRLARAAHADRPSIDGDDVLAWALVRNGRCSDALRWSQHALRLGTEDATKFFHRGAIERCLGHESEARLWLRRALDLNPHFSLLWAPVARRWLA
jgi:tetratricopeptide (TPR) repeat protein